MFSQVICWGIRLMPLENSSLGAFKEEEIIHSRGKMMITSNTMQTRCSAAWEKKLFLLLMVAEPSHRAHHDQGDNQEEDEVKPAMALAVPML